MKLFVGNLPFSANDADLRDLFSEFGTVTDLFVPLDRETRRPRGFAFVTLDSRQSAEAALEALNGQDFGGRPLRISEAVEREERPARPPRGGGDRGDRGDRGGDRGGNWGDRDRKPRYR